MESANAPARAVRRLPRIGGVLLPAGRAHLVTEIFAAREQPDGVTSGRSLVQAMAHQDARFTPGLDDAVQVLAAELRPGSVVVTLSAGDANRVGSELLALRRAGA